MKSFALTFSINLRTRTARTAAHALRLIYPHRHFSSSAAAATKTSEKQHGISRLALSTHQLFAVRALFSFISSSCTARAFLHLSTLVSGRNCSQADPGEPSPPANPPHLGENRTKRQTDKTRQHRRRLARKMRRDRGITCWHAFCRGERRREAPSSLLPPLLRLVFCTCSFGCFAWEFLGVCTLPFPSNLPSMLLSQLPSGLLLQCRMTFPGPVSSLPQWHSLPYSNPQPQLI